MLAEELAALPYPDFVARLGHENLPPGGEATISEWFAHSDIVGKSRVLDLACSTGYSARCVEHRSGAFCIGLDISRTAIARAKAIGVANNSLSTFLVGDAANLPFPSNFFTHIVVGCSFSFIKHREVALAECARVLVSGGLLLCSDFFYRSVPSDTLLAAVTEAIGFRPSPAWTESFWSDFYSSTFTLLYSRSELLAALPDDIVLQVIEQQFERIFPALADEALNVRKSAVARFANTRLILNRHRAHQGLKVSVWRRA